MSARRSRPSSAPGEQADRPPAAASAPPGQPAAAARPPSQKRLRELLRTSPLVSADLRVHWLRVLPYLTAEQRAELAALLAADAPDGRPTGP